MIDTFKVSDLTLGGTSDYVIMSAKGFASGDVRTSQYDIPSKHRAAVPRAFWGARKMLLEIGMKASTQAAYRTLRDDLLKALDLPHKGLTTAYIATTDGRNVRIGVQLRMPVEADFEPGRTTSGIALVDLIAPDPVFYSQTEYTVDVVAAESPKNIDNSGNAPVFPTLLYYGTITNPVSGNAILNETLKYAGTIGATNYLEFDTFDERGDLNKIGWGNYTILEAITGDFWHLEPGSNIITWTGTGQSGSPKLRVVYRYGWLGL